MTYFLAFWFLVTAVRCEYLRLYRGRPTVLFIYTLGVLFFYLAVRGIG